MAELATATTGTIDGGVHVYPVRVYYDDTDAAGIVYYANYLRMAERARTEMLRMIGADHTRLAREDGVSIAVSRCEVDYLEPARLDDDLHIRTRITALGGGEELIVTGLQGFDPDTDGTAATLSVTTAAAVGLLSDLIHGALAVQLRDSPVLGSEGASVALRRTGISPPATVNFGSFYGIVDVTAVSENADVGDGLSG